MNRFIHPIKQIRRLWSSCLWPLYTLFLLQTIGGRYRDNELFAWAWLLSLSTPVLIVLYRLAMPEGRQSRIYPYLRELKIISAFYLAGLVAIVLFMAPLRQWLDLETTRQLMLQAWPGLLVLQGLLLWLIRMHYQHTPQEEGLASIEQFSIPKPLRQICLDYLKTNDIERTLHCLANHFEEQRAVDNHQLLIKLQQQYASNRNQRHLWLITHEEAEVREARLVQYLLQLLNGSTKRHSDRVLPEQKG